MTPHHRPRRTQPRAHERPRMPDGAITETIQVDERTIHCDGGGALGHPRVYLRIDAHDVTCPYCSRHYVLNAGAGGDHSH